MTILEHIKERDLRVAAEVQRILTIAGLELMGSFERHAIEQAQRKAGDEWFMNSTPAMQAALRRPVIDEERDRLMGGAA
jgi:hypothetical protein